MLFLSPRPDAFSANQLRLVGAAAGQLTAVYHNAELRRLLKEQPARPAPAPVERKPAPPEPQPVRAEVQPGTMAAREPRPAPVAVAARQPRVAPASAAQTPVRIMGLTILMVGLAVIAAFVLILVIAPQAPELAAAFGLGGGQPTATLAPTSEATQAAAGASAEAAAAATETAAPTVSATAAEPTATPTESPTATPTPAPTDTPTRTASPTRTLTPTATLPGGVQALAVVTLPEGLAARLRDTPGGTVIAGVLDGAQVEVLEGREEVDDIVWVRIRDEDGQEGWIAEDLLEILPR
jgi:hypothetical protein